MCNYIVENSHYLHIFRILSFVSMFLLLFCRSIGGSGGGGTGDQFLHFQSNFWEKKCLNNRVGAPFLTFTFYPAFSEILDPPLSVTKILGFTLLLLLVVIVILFSFLFLCMHASCTEYFGNRGTSSLQST